MSAAARREALQRVIRRFSWGLVFWVVAFLVCLILGEGKYSIACVVMFVFDGALLIEFRRVLSRVQDEPTDGVVESQ